MRLKDADAIQIGVYYEALAGFTIERVRDAADRWKQTGRFFPTTGEWATLCRELRDAVPAWQPKVRVTCETCNDSGWVYRDCQPETRCGSVRCLDRGAEYTHVFVVRCACFTADVEQP